MDVVFNWYLNEDLMFFGVYFVKKMDSWILNVIEIYD